MTRNRTSWQPGQSGNPRGNPGKKRALTRILETVGAKKLAGLSLPARRLVAERLWEAVTTGRIHFGLSEDDVSEGYADALYLTYAEWLDTVRFLYSQIDGPPKTQMEVAGPEGGPIQHRDATIDYGALTTEQLDALIAALEFAGLETGEGAA